MCDIGFPLRPSPHGGDLLSPQCIGCANRFQSARLTPERLTNLVDGITRLRIIRGSPSEEGPVSMVGRICNPRSASHRLESPFQFREKRIPLEREGDDADAL
jgi:hypothetical protein